MLIEGFRPGVAARLGLGYEEPVARQSRPDLSLDQRVWAGRSLFKAPGLGFGGAGLFRAGLGQSRQRQAFRTGSAHTISDVATGVYAFQAIATALFARATVGTGRWIDVNLAQSTAALLGHKAAEYVLEGGAPRALNVPAGSYQTSDGWMMVTLVNEAQYKRLCTAIEREDLATDPRFADFAGAC